MIPSLDIKRKTKELRKSDGPLWLRIRQLLRDKGINPQTTVLAYSEPEDAQYEFGVIVTESGGVYQYGYDYLRRGIAQGIFAEWNDITNNYRKSPYKEEVELSLELTRKRRNEEGDI